MSKVGNFALGVSLVDFGMIVALGFWVQKNLSAIRSVQIEQQESLTTIHRVLADLGVEAEAIPALKEESRRVSTVLLDYDEKIKEFQNIMEGKIDTEVVNTQIELILESLSKSGESPSNVVKHHLRKSRRSRRSKSSSSSSEDSSTASDTESTSRRRRRRDKTSVKKQSSKSKYVPPETEVDESELDPSSIIDAVRAASSKKSSPSHARHR